MPMNTVWRSVVEALDAEGVEYVFGLPGNPKHLLYDLTERTKIPFVLMRDEKSAVACAYAYARLRRRPGVVFSNPGPGITNLVTGLLEATSGSLPVVAIANGVVQAHDGMGAFQELDSVALMRPVTKWAVRITDPRRVSWALERAFTLAVNGRPGAVFVEIPSDMADAQVEMPAYRPSLPRHRLRPDPDAVSEAARLLGQAQRPLLLCGSGAVSARASDEVRTLAERVGMPVFTTPGGRGIYPEDLPLAMGQTGLYFTEPGKAYHDSTDLIFSVGSRLEAFSTNSWSFWPQSAKFIQLDIEPGTISLNMRPDVGLVGDAGLALQDVLSALPEIDPAAKRARLEFVEKLKADYEPAYRDAADGLSRPIRVPRVLAAVNRVFGKDTVLMKENGGADLWCYYWPHYKVLDVDDCVPMAEQTAMGMGVIGAIGAKLAKPDKKVVCFAGDGAMQMSIVELATAAELKCGVTWIVLNNQAFGWVQYNQLLNNKPFIGTGFSVAADFVEIARAQSCVGIRLTDPEMVEDALTEALEANMAGVPALIDVDIARHDYHPHFQRVHVARLEH